MVNEEIQALKQLRAMLVETRRQRVSECLQFGWACGNERRLIEIQNAIAAVDAAILDEYRLPLEREQVAAAEPRSATSEAIRFPGMAARAANDLGQGGRLEADRRPIAVGGNGWQSYQDWTRSNGHRIAS